MASCCLNEATRCRRTSLAWHRADSRQPWGSHPRFLICKAGTGPAAISEGTGVGGRCQGSSSGQPLGRCLGTDRLAQTRPQRPEAVVHDGEPRVARAGSLHVHFCIGTARCRGTGRGHTGDLLARVRELPPQGAVSPQQVTLSSGPVSVPASSGRKTARRTEAPATLASRASVVHAVPPVWPSTRGDIARPEDGGTLTP